MGVDKVNLSILTHGTPSGGDTPEVTIHWGNLSIDETHPMGFVAFNAMRADYASASPAPLRAKLYAWMTSAPVSTAAWGKRADVFDALVEGWGGP